MKYQKYIAVFIAFLLCFFVLDTQAQCAMCKATAEKSAYAKSLNTGILYLLLAPVALLGSIALIWIKNRKSFMQNEEN